MRPPSFRKRWRRYKLENIIICVRHAFRPITITLRKHAKSQPQKLSFISFVAGQLACFQVWAPISCGGQVAALGVECLPNKAVVIEFCQLQHTIH